MWLKPHPQDIPHILSLEAATILKLIWIFFTTYPLRSHKLNPIMCFKMQMNDTHTLVYLAFFTQHCVFEISLIYICYNGYRVPAINQAVF